MILQLNVTPGEARVIAGLLRGDDTVLTDAERHQMGNLATMIDDQRKRLESAAEVATLETIEVKHPCNPTTLDYISLSKLTGKPITDVLVGLSSEFGDPVVDVSYIVFADATTAHVQGEHDIAYITGEDQPNLDYDTLERLYNEQCVDEDDDEDSKE